MLAIMVASILLFACVRDSESIEGDWLTTDGKDMLVVDEKDWRYEEMNYEYGTSKTIRAGVLRRIDARTWVLVWESSKDGNEKESVEKVTVRRAEGGKVLVAFGKEFRYVYR